MSDTPRRKFLADLQAQAVHDQSRRRTISGWVGTTATQDQSSTPIAGNTSNPTNQLRRTSGWSFAGEQNQTNTLRRTSGWSFAAEQRRRNIPEDLTLPLPARKTSNRTSLVPSRGILKQSNYDDNHTVIGVMTAPIDDGNTTEIFKKRRVSFAPKATTYQW
jgi:hypothetical protein